MIRALFKKQMAEVFSWLFMDTRKKTRRTGKGLAGFLVLYGALILYLGAFMFLMAKSLCQALAPLGLTWFYFAIMGLVALVLGVFGSVFNTYASLYLAKDNDMLLSMPIPPRYILTARLAGVYLTGLFFEMIVMLPATVAWFVYGTPTLLGGIFALLIPFVLSFFVLSLSCLLGFLVAIISAHIRHKSLVITVLSLGLLGLYMWGYTKLMSSLTELLAVVGEIAEAAKGPLYPLYHMGLSTTGKPLSFLIFTAIILGVFALVCAVLSRTFLTLAITNKGGAKRKYKRERTTQKSVERALLWKEWKRFLASPIYMLNCGLGALFLPIAGVMMLVFREDIHAMLPMISMMFGDEALLPLILAAMACMMGVMTDVTAPSISLEGKNLWILQSLPVSPLQVLHAKLKLHLLIAIPATAVAVTCLLIAVPPALPFFFLIPAATLLFTVLIALFGLFMNLKSPNFTWTSETVPVKQSLSVTATIFGGWGTVLALGGLYYLLQEYIAPALYLGLCCIILAGLCTALYVWLRRKGTAILAAL